MPTIYQYVRTYSLDSQRRFLRARFYKDTTKTLYL